MRARRIVALSFAPVLATALAGCRAVPEPEPPPPPPVFPVEWRVVDLTRTLDADAPYLPHDGAFPFERISLETTAAGRRVGAWSAVGLMGTHVEAPGVFQADDGADRPAQGLERIATEHLSLPVVVIEAPPALVALEGADAATAMAVGIPAILEHESHHGRIPVGALVVLRTGDGDVASRTLALAGERPVGGYAHRGWSADAVSFLAGEREVRALGTDALTVDPGSLVDESPAARAAAKAGLYTVLCLANLGTLPKRGAVAVIGLLPVRGALAAQARVLAYVPPRTPEATHADAQPGTTREP